MLGSGALCGQIADRTGRFDLVLYVCLAVGVLALVALQATAYATAWSLMFGLVGLAPAGIIMALTGEVVAKERRAFGIGVFLSAYYLIVAPAPAIAGRLFDLTHWAFGAILFAVALMVLAGLANFAFRPRATLVMFRAIGAGRDGQICPVGTDLISKPRERSSRARGCKF